MSNLLKELQRLTPKFPEVEFEVPEWGRTVILRGFSLREGRELRQANGEGDDERLMIRTLAHAIADGDERPLANDDGYALLEGLSPKTLQEMGAAFMKISGAGQDAEGNSEARAVAAGSSSDSPSPSAARSLN